MHDMLRARLLRNIEALPEDQLYDALDYVEFLASKYARERLRAASGMQKLGEMVEDKMRVHGLGMSAIRGTMNALGTADRVFSGLSEAGKSLYRSVEESWTATAAPAPPAVGDAEQAAPSLPPSAAEPGVSVTPPTPNTEP